VLLGCDFAWRQFYPEGARIVQITYHRHEAPPPDPLAPLTQYQTF
jgi:hypothetical protein